MAPATEADNNFDTHEWKSEFASTRSGRNSPNIFAKVRRKLLLTPPVRNARSPRLTEEELDALTGDLPYATNYTYAYSKIYDPSLPDHWEVPNLGGTTSGSLSEQEHWSAASLSRQLLYILRFPVYLVLHVITYILEAFYHVIKITSFTIWDYLLYLVKLAKTRYYAYQDHRRRTALIRNRQEPFSTKAARSIRRFFEILVYVVLTPYRMLTRSNNGVEQYQYRSIKDQLENERASRMTTRSQTLERSRKFDGLSKSPARRAAPAFVKTSTITRITAKVFSSSPFGEGTSENITPTVVTTRTVKQRSVTPRFRQTRATREAITRALDTPELEIDTPLSTYGLRSRGLSHLNTPEPTFDIGHAAATSTPLFPQETYNYQYEEATGNKIKTAFTWLGYLILFPFFAARHVWYTFYDYGKSAYMKLTNYQQAPMETIHVRDINEPAPSSSDVHDAVGVSWRIRIADFLSSFVATIVEAHQVVFAMFKGGIVETVSYFGGLFAGLTDKKSSKFSWCQILGLLLALLFAIFLLGFLTSDNTAIRVKEITKDKNASKKSEGSLPAVPIWISAANHVKHYTWMVKEFVVDIAFDTYNYGKSTIGRLGTTPRYAWDLIASGCGAVGNGLKSVLSSSFRFIDFCAGKLFYYGSDGFLSANKSIGTFFNGCYETLYNGCTAIVGHTKSFIYNASNAVYNFFSTIFAGLLNFSTSSQNSILSLLKSFGTGITNIFYNFIYAPIAGVFNFAGDNYMYFFNEVAAVFGKVYNSVVSVLKTVINWILFLIAYPFSLCTRAWIRISQYAPEDVVQVIPIPQAITPTPDVERIVEEPLRKVTDVEDEELVIIPAPAPKPIPVPAPTPAPVIIHQTNVVETVDKDAIIKEVTEKLRAELSAQFQQELSAKFEQNYNTIIEQLKMENTNIQYDKNHLEAIIRQMIYEYDTDKTGKVDYALESSGGAVVSTRCSETYKSYTRLEKFWDIPIYYFHYSPRVVIQRNSKSLFPGECWCFKESRGYIAVELSHYIDVSSISYEHIGSEVAPEGNRSSAPKGVLVWAYKQIDDLNSRVLIGDYTYDLDGPPLQFFLAKHKPDFPVKFVELEVTSNYGAPFTCLYRLRVHGKVVQV